MPPGQSIVAADGQKLVVNSSVGAGVYILDRIDGTLKAREASEPEEYYGWEPFHKDCEFLNVSRTNALLKRKHVNGHYKVILASQSGKEVVICDASPSDPYDSCNIHNLYSFLAPNGKIFVLIHFARGESTELIYGISSTPDEADTFYIEKRDGFAGMKRDDDPNAVIAGSIDNKWILINYNSSRARWTTFYSLDSEDGQLYEEESESLPEQIYITHKHHLPDGKILVCFTEKNITKIKILDMDTDTDAECPELKSPVHELIVSPNGIIVIIDEAFNLNLYRYRVERGLEYINTVKRPNNFDKYNFCRFPEENPEVVEFLVLGNPPNLPKRVTVNLVGNPPQPNDAAASSSQTPMPL